MPPSEQQHKKTHFRYAGRSTAYIFCEALCRAGAPPTGVPRSVLLPSTDSAALHSQAIRRLDVNAPNAAATVLRAAWQAGVPIILVGHQPGSFPRFASAWLRDGATTSDDGETSTANGESEREHDALTAALDVGRMRAQLGDEQVPILRREYCDSAPIKEHTTLGAFLDDHWLRGDAGAYLHQWQFPLSKTAVPKLCFRCDALPCLDDNLLKHWLDICLGDNPLQYLFMGQASTYSKLHVDPGGLDLLIAPLSPSRWRPACLESVNKG